MKKGAEKYLKNGLQSKNSTGAFITKRFSSAKIALQQKKDSVKIILSEENSEEMKIQSFEMYLIIM